MHVSFFLDGHPPNANKRRRMHWTKIAEETRSWKAASYLAAINARNSLTSVWWEVPDRALVQLTFFFRDRRRHDLDNELAGSKAIIDGLVGVLIKDDDFEHMELAVRGEAGSVREGVEVLVTA